VYDIIVDNPYETIADREETVHAVSQLPRSAYISVFSLTFFKHTALYDKAKGDGYQVDAHLGKKPDYWEKDSPEVNALKIAALVGEPFALKILHNASGSDGFLMKRLSQIAVRVLEPLRHLKMLYLSCGKRNPEFVRQLFVHARDYAYRYFSFSRTNRMAH
jgi:hypothetical protein